MRFRLATYYGMIREYLDRVAAAERKRRERKALERTFQRIGLKIGRREWKRADLYVRS